MKKTSRGLFITGGVTGIVGAVLLVLFALSIFVVGVVIGVFGAAVAGSTGDEQAANDTMNNIINALSVYTIPALIVAVLRVPVSIMSFVSTKKHVSKPYMIVMIVLSALSICIISLIAAILRLVVISKGMENEEISE